MELTKIKIEELYELLDDKYYLAYVDYRDDLSEQADTIQKAIHKGIEYLDEEVFDWFSDDYEAINYALKELQNNIEKKYSILEDEAVDIIEEFRELLIDEIRNRDKSNPLDDLISNTRPPVAFYDTGIYINHPDDNKEYKESIRAIKKALGLKLSDKTYDDLFYELLNNAYYGGNICIYFNMDLKDWLNYKSLEDTKYIEFSGDVAIALFDAYNGSGYHIHLPCNIILPYERTNVFLDKSIKYNYTYAVCGMSSDWCEGTSVTLSNRPTKIKTTVKSSNLNHHIELEEQYNKTYKAGKCTFGDMDIRRHRDVAYKIDYPAGNKCPHCGTFFID